MVYVEAGYAIEPLEAVLRSDLVPHYSRLRIFVALQGREFPQGRVGGERLRFLCDLAAVADRESVDSAVATTLAAALTLLHIEKAAGSEDAAAVLDDPLFSRVAAWLIRRGFM